MKKMIFFLAIIGLLSFFVSRSNAQAPGWIWSRASGCATEYLTSCSSSVDGDGNCYITGGYVDPKISFGSDTLYNNIVPPTCSSCFFLVKYSRFGDVLWTKSPFNGMYYSHGRSVCTDNYGNVYLGGVFNDSLRIDTAKVVSVWTRDIFIAKFNPFGDLIWLKSYGSFTNEELFS